MWLLFTVWGRNSCLLDFSVWREICTSKGVLQAGKVFPHFHIVSHLDRSVMR
jgi:hypothetical protein